MPIAPDFVPRAAQIHSAHRGEVIPPPSVVARLQQKSPRLGLRWMTGAHVPYWALTQRWEAGDARWEQVRTGRLPEDRAWDMVHLFPLSVTTEDMAAYVEERWSDTAHRKEGGEAAKEATTIAETSMGDASDVREAHVRRVTQDSLERHERESRHALRVRAGAEKAHPMIEVP